MRCQVNIKIHWNNLPFSFLLPSVYAMRRHTLWASLFPVILACSVACARSHSIEKRSKVCLPVVPFADVGSTVVCKNGIPRLVKGGCELGYRLLQSQYFDVCQRTSIVCRDVLSTNTFLACASSPLLLPSYSRSVIVAHAHAHAHDGLPLHSQWLRLADQLATDTCVAAARWTKRTRVFGAGSDHR